MKTKALSTALALLLAAALAADGPPPPPEVKVPEHGRKPADFAPKGWSLFQSAAGDFDGDGIADAAMAFETDRPDQDDLLWRLLVLARGSGNGELRRIWASTRVLPSRDQIGPMTIEKGALVLRRWHSETRVWLRRSGGESRVARFDEREADAFIDKVQHPYGWRRSFDAASGWLENEQQQHGCRLERERVLLVPLVAEVPTGKAWPGPELTLGPDDVRPGSAPVSGPEDVTARITAVTMDPLHEDWGGRFLEARITVTDDDVQPGDRVRLITPDRRELPFVEMKREPVPGGWIVRARWSIEMEWVGEPAVSLPYKEKFLQEAPSGRAGILAFEVIDRDGNGRETVLTTGPDGRNEASFLLLDTTQNSPTLADVLEIKDC